MSSESAAAPRAVVAGHGDFAAGIVSAVQAITGQGSAFRTVTNSGMSGDALAQAMRSAVTEHQATVIFTDLPGGSCTMAARRLTKEMPAVRVVTGANLPMLLEFALGVVDAGAVDRAVEKGKQGVVASPAPEGARAD